MRPIDKIIPKTHTSDLRSFWTLTPEHIYAALHCGSGGLNAQDAEFRLAQYGPNSDAEGKNDSLLRAVFRRLLEPLSLILLAAGVISVATGDAIGGSIIVAILAISVGLDTIQEGHAVRAAEALRCSVALKAEVKRSGTFREIFVDKVVPGDILRVRAGDIIPADALILESTAFTAGEAALTGEPYPVEKRPGIVTSASPGEASNALFRGAVAQTGEAIALAVNTGRATVFGAAASALAEAQAQSPFQRDLHEFGLVIARLTLGLVVVVLAIRVVFGRPVLDSLMFAVALAVGLTPELLPMITTVTLSRGALRMARRKVIVKRLASIHDLGSMTVLCTDKTGTLTSAEISLARSLNLMGADDPRASRLGAIAAQLGGDRGSLDAALTHAPRTPRQAGPSPAGTPSIFAPGGIVLRDGPEGSLLIVKGAPEGVLPLCTKSDGRHRTPPMERNNGGCVGAFTTLAGMGFAASPSHRVRGRGRPTSRCNGRSRPVFEGLCALPIRPSRRRQRPSPGSQKRESGSRSSPATTPSS